MWLQKLVYIAHGWNLAISREPLVSQQPEAWDNGPVFRSLWNHIRDYGIDRVQRLLVDPVTKELIQTDLTDSEASIVDHVWDKYGHYSGHQLSRLTHKPDTPWTKSYLRRGRNAPIPDSETKEHYVQLALAGRESN